VHFTVPLRAVLARFITAHGVRSMYDAPCGAMARGSNQNKHSTDVVLLLLIRACV